MARSREGGQATVELVLVMPVLVALVLTVVQIGVVTRDRLLLTHAAREAARAASVQPEHDPALAAALAAAGGLAPDRVTVELGPERASGSRLEVTVRYRAPTEVPVVGLLVPDVVMTTAVTVRVE